MRVPARFEYEVARSVDEAVGLLGRHGSEARLLAGGHDLLLRMKTREVSPSVIVDLHELDGDLRYVREEGGVLKVGALARHRDVLDSPVVRERYEVLADAEALVADPLVRNLGTVGGSLAQGDPSGDLPAAFTALGAEVSVRGSGGERTLPVEELYTGYKELALGPDEIITEVRVPTVPTASAYAKVKRRAGAWASAAVAVAVTMEDGDIADARVGLCGVGRTTLRAGGAEEVLWGQAPSRELFEEAGRKAAEAADPIGDNRGSAEYKADLARVMLVRALEKAVERASRGGA